MPRLEKKQKKYLKKQWLEIFQFDKNYKHTDPRISTKPRHKKHKVKYTKACHNQTALVKMSDKKENIQ